MTEKELGSPLNRIRLPFLDQNLAVLAVVVARRSDVGCDVDVLSWDQGPVRSGPGTEKMTIFSSNAVFGRIKASDTKPVGTNNFFCFLQLNDTVDNA